MPEHDAVAVVKQDLAYIEGNLQRARDLAAEIQKSLNHALDCRDALTGLLVAKVALYEQLTGETYLG